MMVMIFYKLWFLGFFLNYKNKRCSSNKEFCVFDPWPGIWKGKTSHLRAKTQESCFVFLILSIVHFLHFFMPGPCLVNDHNHFLNIDYKCSRWRWLVCWQSAWFADPAMQWVKIHKVFYGGDALLGLDVAKSFYSDDKLKERDSMTVRGPMKALWWWRWTNIYFFWSIFSSHRLGDRSKPLFSFSCLRKKVWISLVSFTNPLPEKQVTRISHSSWLGLVGCQVGDILTFLRRWQCLGEIQLRRAWVLDDGGLERHIFLNINIFLNISIPTLSERHKQYHISLEHNGPLKNNYLALLTKTMHASFLQYINWWR